MEWVLVLVLVHNSSSFTISPSEGDVITNPAPGLPETSHSPPANDQRRCCMCPPQTVGTGLPRWTSLNREKGCNGPHFTAYTCVSFEDSPAHTPIAVSELSMACGYLRICGGT